MVRRDMTPAIRDVMTREVLTVAPETTLRDAVELLAFNHLSGAPVLDGQRLVGVITASDLLEFAATSPGVPTMREELEDVIEWPQTSVEEEVDGGDESGATFFADMWEDAGADAAERMGTPGGPEWSLYDDHVVGEVMTRNVLTLPSSASLRAAAEMMQEHRIHRVVITDDGAVVGIVSALDIAKAAANGAFDGRGED
jgi:CBS domain-containing protein